MRHLLLSGLFFLFAAFQYNDPDFYIWVPIYMVVAIVVFFFGRGVYNPSIFKVLTALYILAMFLYYPEVINWIKEGTPSITGSMKAESPFIEFIREFFGLGICALVLAYYSYLAGNKRVNS
ncbi:MAG: transmembrane 220 family protein [Saprospiraceae bacterium]|nr:transmembrane 220 family protein [Saprospiraceae bacterium]